MKILITILVLFLFVTGFDTRGQDILTTTGGINVNEGDVCEIVNMAGTVALYSTNMTLLAYLSYSGTTPYQANAGIFPVAGPCIIAPGPTGSLKGVVSYRIRPNISATNNIPANAVVIPTDSTGDVQILLESSTDLVNWTQANPGTYGASSSKRFFRVRAVR